VTVPAPVPVPVPAPGRHGGDAAHIAGTLGVPLDSLLDLSVSLNPVGPDVANVAAAHLNALGRYPDAGPGRRLLAGTIGVEPDCLLLTNGGAEAISLLAQLVGGRVDEPEFSLYPRGVGAAPLWRSNPHNPTGMLAGAEERADVWDEAFFPLATGRWTRHDDGSMAVVGSLTKLFACPGLRIGYVMAAPALIAQLEERQPEWAVGGLELALLPALLAEADLPRWAAEIADLRGELTALLAGHGLAPRPSDANFVLCDAPDRFRDKLLGQGIVVRDCASFGLPELARIAVPHHEGIERLSTALDAITHDP
jgi:histidinol-phosphate/aromatic aminotransferase/cobyric acid decarboxylase-like protein